MPHRLQNQQLEIVIDLPQENYQLPRFDWTGKIVAVSYMGRLVSGTELETTPTPNLFGRGFYNEFGISKAVGYEETANGDWFHKIGVGLLQKEEGPYNFQKAYAIRPASFEITSGTDHLLIKCQSARHNDYAYTLEKKIQLLDDGFSMAYTLTNLGQKPIRTDEYCHNFLALDGALMGPDYHLTFPFSIQQTKLDESVNPERLISLGEQEVEFLGTPTQPFFFSNLSGGAQVSAEWKLEHRTHRIGISETGDFPTNSINLWGWKHVVSPELFHEIDLPAGQQQKWSRTYRIYDLD